MSRERDGDAGPMGDLLPFDREPSRQGRAEIETSDDAARRRILENLDESQIVEAAAGTGKTTQLVGRLVAVLASGRTTVDRIVAVTFTRKAAGELALRLRQELDRERQQATDPQVRRRHEEAIAHLEEAKIGTIHSFCADLLRQRPLEAGIDPGFRELDEEQARELHARVFRGWVERRLDEMPPGLRRALSRLAVRASGPDRTPLDDLQEAAWTLVDWRDHPAAWRRPEGFDRAAEIPRLVGRVREVAARARLCPDRRDYLRRALEPAIEVDDWIRSSTEATGRPVGELDQDALEARLAGLLPRAMGGRQARWKGRGKRYADGVPREEMAAERDALLAELESFQALADADLAAALKTELDEVTRAYEEAKADEGCLDFLDLLLLARNLVRDRRDVRSLCQERFTHVFVDEFQDTDPVQAEILVLLSADDPAEDDWRRVRPVPGKLFLVGDPKQSIYRFRRADVVLYRDIARGLGEKGVARLVLNRSFRSVRPIQEAVNAAFEPVMDGDERAGQPEYVPLGPHREAPEGQPSVVVLPVPRPYGFRDQVTGRAVDESLPEAVGAFVRWLVEESGWRVEDESRRRVPVAPRHVCLLFRRFVTWGRDVTVPYVRALESRGVPHVLIGGRSLHQREEVETVRMALTAIEWPDDELAVFATLKRGLFGVPDDLLLRYREAAGTLNPFRRPPDDLADDLLPVAEVLETIVRLHRRRNRRPIAATLHELLRETRAHAAFALRPAGQQALANVQHVSDLARRFELRGGLSFRGFVEWLTELAERPDARQSPVVEEAAEGVRLMTVHSAKGLEFPVVLLVDPTCQVTPRQPGRTVDTEAGLAAFRLLGWSPVELTERADLEQDRERAEAQRVAYVAATRARDLLVVPGVGTAPLEGWAGVLQPAVMPPRERWRGAGPAPGCPAFGRDTVLFLDDEVERTGSTVAPGTHRPAAGAHEVVWWAPSALDLQVEERFGLRQQQLLAEDPGRERVEERLDHHRAWRARHLAAVERGAVPSVRVRPVTALEEGPPGPGEGTSPAPILLERTGAPERSSAGTRFGTLVHTVLRDVALDADGAAVRRLVDLEARVLGSPPEEAGDAAAAVAAVLAHPRLRAAAAAAAVRRELPFILPLADGSLVEGTIDLAFRNSDGLWCVIDFKTDLDVGPLEEYRRQLGWYLHALQALTGETAEGVLLGV